MKHFQIFSRDKTPQGSGMLFMAIPTLCLPYLNLKHVTFNWNGHIFNIVTVDSILKTKEEKFTKNYKL